MGETGNISVQEKKVSSTSTIWELALGVVEKDTPGVNDTTNINEINQDNKIVAGTDEAIVNINESAENVVIFLGSKNCGKTSMILRVLERDEPPKPTIALEYTFGRRARGHNLVKDVGHLWELGGGTTMIDLLDIAFNKDTFMYSSIIAVVDLSKVDELWSTLEILFSHIKKQLEKLVGDASPEQVKQLMSNVSKLRNLDEHPERDMLSPISLPIVIVGSKYDIFQEFEPEKKKAICKTLRFLAHVNGAALMFYSGKIETLTARTKSLLSHLLFKTPLSKHLITDYNKPLSILAGMDSFQQIGAPPVKGDGVIASDASTPVDLWKNAFTSNFPQKPLSVRQQEVSDPASDSQFTEPKVDSLRVQKDEELRRYRQKRAIEEKYGKD